MCDVCHMTPHHPSCPYAPDPPVIHTCSRCGEGICAGDQFLRELDGDIFCEVCLENMSIDDLLVELGLHREIAERRQWP